MSPFERFLSGRFAPILGGVGMLAAAVWGAADYFIGPQPSTAEELLDNMKWALLTFVVLSFASYAVLLWQTRRCLVPYLDEIIVGHNLDGEKVVWAVVNIRNTGTQTVADHWRTFLQTRRKNVELTKEFFSTEISLLTPDSREVFTKGCQSLLTKTLAPIPEGGSCRGILLYRVKTWPEVGDVFELTFQDAWRRKHKLKKVLTPDMFRVDPYGDCELVVTPLAMPLASRKEAPRLS